MLLVKTVVKESGIAGRGLFADEDISQGTKVWVFEESVDLAFSKDDVSSRSQVIQEDIKTYAYLSKVSGRYIYPADNGRFMNHSFSPNIDVTFSEESDEDIDIAARDIKKGEELTINYEQFDKEFASYKDTYW